MTSSLLFSLHIFFRHIGQVQLRFSHIPRHFSWKLWLQLRMETTHAVLSFVSKISEQIGQSFGPPSLLFRSLSPCCILCDPFCIRWARYSGIGCFVSSGSSSSSSVSLITIAFLAAFCRRISTIAIFLWTDNLSVLQYTWCNTNRCFRASFRCGFEWSFYVLRALNARTCYYVTTETKPTSQIHLFRLSEKKHVRII